MSRLISALAFASLAGLVAASAGEKKPEAGPAGNPAPADGVQMEVRGIIVDPASQSPVIILATVDKTLILPITIGENEAIAIWRYLKDVESPRPLTHDLLGTVIEQLGAKIDKITVTDLKEGTFYARIDLKAGPPENTRTVKIDARPSDSIALALKTGTRIYVAQKVIDAAGRPLGGDDKQPKPERRLERNTRNDADDAI